LIVANNSLHNIKEYCQNLNLLFVEDNRQTRESTLDLLNNFFNNIVVAENGEEGFGKYTDFFNQKDRYFDIVLSDIKMPKLDGIAMVKKIYKLNKNQLVIILSAHDDKDSLLNLIELGVDGFIQKPVKLERLIDVLTLIIDKLNDNEIIKISKECIYHKDLKTINTKDSKVLLNSSEYQLIELLLNNTNHYMGLEQIHNHIYYDDIEKEFSSEAIRAIIKRLRKKLPVDTIQNSRTLGYKIDIKSQ
jgi:DNA-binding response OmpR family regulator